MHVYKRKGEKIEGWAKALHTDLSADALCGINERMWAGLAV